MLTSLHTGLRWFLQFLCVAICGIASAQNPNWSLAENPQLESFFREQVDIIKDRSDLTKFRSIEEWKAAQTILRQQLFEMLGLAPLPEKTPLQATVTGTLTEADFTVEKIHFQSMPGLYVTGSLYLPKQQTEPAPAVLYVCGHGPSKKDNISFGNKVTYQHHGAWFARNGYVCLTIDTLQMGEIEGIHHGTHRYNRWWWNSRGYTPAGVEAWNCIRALDYLQSRHEVDGNRLGVTGRSGGGAYSWWIAALDERIQCAVPVAGITTLRNHVVDGCVEGHCDCMFFVNTYQWDYAKLAALVAPRPLLISNTDKDTIFPLEGVVEIHRQVRHIYQLYGKPENLGLCITEGPHKDTQELRTHAFVWMNRFLKQNSSQFSEIATPFFQPEQLRVFSDLPADEQNTHIDEQFVPEAPVPEGTQIAARLAENPAWLSELRNQLQLRSFAAWPNLGTLDSPVKFEALTQVESVNIHLQDTPNDQPSADQLSANQPLNAQQTDKGLVLKHTIVSFDSQRHVPLTLSVYSQPETELSAVRNVHVLLLDELGWNVAQQILQGQASADRFAVSIRQLLGSINKEDNTAVAIFAARGVGPHAWNGSESKQIQIQRRFQLLGMTADGMRVWDNLVMLNVIRNLMNKDIHLTVSTSAASPDVAMCTAIFDQGPPWTSLDLTYARPMQHEDRTILNLSRTVSDTELLLLTLTHTPITVPDPAIPPYATTLELTSQTSWSGHKVTAP
ncbi:MAG: acetylxylan esterase [Planctomyces sp.]|nr:acetylxylan esterase [Planctomyces sp.]